MYKELNSTGDLTDNLYQSDSIVTHRTRVSKRASVCSLCPIIGAFGPVRSGVQAERSEFIEEPGRRPQSGDTKIWRAKGASSSTAQAAGVHASGAGARYPNELCGRR